MRYEWTIALVLTFALSGASETPADEPPVEGESVALGKGEESLRKVIDAARATLAQKPAYEVRVHTRWKSGTDQQMKEGKKEYAMTVVRPASIRLTVTSLPNDSPDLLVVGDGRTLVTYLPALRIYSASAMLGPRAGLEKNVVIAETLVGSGLEIVARPDASAFVLAQVSNILDRGEEESKDIKGRHFSLSWGEARVQLWFTSGPQPLLQRMKRSSKLETAKGPAFELEIESDLEWNFVPKIEADTFRPAHPTGARKVADLHAYLAGEETEGLALDPGAVELTRLDGGTGPLAKESPTVVLLLAAWAPDGLQLVEKFGKANLGKTTGTHQALVVIADELDSVKRLSTASAQGLDAYLDRTGELATALGVEEIPILAVLRDGKAVWHQRVDAESFDKTFQEAAKQ